MAMNGSQSSIDTETSTILGIANIVWYTSDSFVCWVPVHLVWFGTWSEHEYTEKEQSMPLDHDAKMEDLHLCELSAPLVISLFFWSLRVCTV